MSVKMLTAMAILSTRVKATILSFGDNGQITAAAQDIVDSEGWPIHITLGLVETIESLIGGSDTITTGIGRDIVLTPVLMPTLLMQALMSISSMPTSGVRSRFRQPTTLLLATAAISTGQPLTMQGIYADITTPDGGALPGDDNNAADIGSV